MASFYLQIKTCGQNHQDEEKLVKLFVKEWLASNGSKECADKFLDIHDSYLNNKDKRDFLFSWFSLFCKNINEEINRNKGLYQIVSHQDNNITIKEFNLKLVDYSGVYYLQSGNKILTNLIVKNKKIISFAQC